MNSKPMLFECLDCGETYLADNLFDKCMHGVDLGSGKDSTVFTIHVNIGQVEKVTDVALKKIAKAIEENIKRAPKGPPITYR